MSRFIVTLSDEERAALERVRAKLGQRSHADTVRLLVKQADSQVSPAEAALELQRLSPAGDRINMPSAQTRALEQAVKNDVREQAGANRVAVPLAGTFERKPMQKGRSK